MGFLISACTCMLTEYLLFQNLVGSLERSRSTMAEDLANLSAQNETLKNEVDTIPSLKQVTGTCSYDNVS